MWKLVVKKKWRLLRSLLNFAASLFLAHSVAGIQIKLIFIYVGVFYRCILGETKGGWREEDMFFVIFCVIWTIYNIQFYGHD